VGRADSFLMVARIAGLVVAETRQGRTSDPAGLWQPERAGR
jgi:hypothetical protein